MQVQSDQEFEEGLQGIPLARVVKLERALIARFREIKAGFPSKVTSKGELPKDLGELVEVFWRFSIVESVIMKRRSSPEEARTTREIESNEGIDREIAELLRQMTKAQV